MVFLYYPFQYQVIGTLTDNRHLAMRDGAARGLRMKWFCRIGLAAIAFLLFAALEPVQAQSKRVVLLHSFGQDFKPWSEYARSIRSELQRQSPWQLDITDHSL